MMRIYFAKKGCLLFLLFAGLLWFSSCGEDESVDEAPKYPPRIIRVETNGSSRVLIQQLDPPVDLLVREMKAGDQAEVIARGPCKLFCSAGEFVRLDNNGSVIELGRTGPIAKEF